MQLLFQLNSWSAFPLHKIIWHIESGELGQLRSDTNLLIFLLRRKLPVGNYSKDSDTIGSCYILKIQTQQPIQKVIEKSKHMALCAHIGFPLSLNALSSNVPPSFDQPQAICPSSESYTLQALGVVQGVMAHWWCFRGNGKTDSEKLHIILVD